MLTIARNYWLATKQDLANHQKLLWSSTLETQAEFLRASRAVVVGPYASNSEMLSSADKTKLRDTLVALAKRKFQEAPMSGEFQV